MIRTGRTFLIFVMLATQMVSAAPDFLPYPAQQARTAGSSYYVPNYSYNRSYSQAPAFAPAYGFGVGNRQVSGYWQRYSYNSPFGYARPYQTFPGFNQGFGGGGMFGGGGGLLSSLFSMLFGGFGGGGMFGGGQNFGYGNNGFYQQQPAYYQQPQYQQSYQQQPQQYPTYQTAAVTPPPAMMNFAGAQPSVVQAPAEMQQGQSQIADAPAVTPPAALAQEQSSGGERMAQTNDNVALAQTQGAVAPNPRDSAHIRTVPFKPTLSEAGQIKARNRGEFGAQRAPIWKPFIKRFQKCAPGCEPIGYSAWADNRRSCHNGGRAIDVFGMRCADGVHMAIHSSRDNGRFAQLVTCMAGPKPRDRNLRVKDGLGCLWHNGSNVTTGHRNHAHFTLGCYSGHMW